MMMVNGDAIFQFDYCIVLSFLIPFDIFKKSPSHHSNMHLHWRLRGHSSVFRLKLPPVYVHSTSAFKGEDKFSDFISRRAPMNLSSFDLSRIDTVSRQYNVDMHQIIYFPLLGC